MDQLAHLIIRVDGEGVKQAAENLDKTAQAAGRVEQATDKAALAAKKAADQALKHAQAKFKATEDEINRVAKEFAAIDRMREAAAQKANRIEQSRLALEARLQQQADSATLAREKGMEDFRVSAQNRELERRRKVVEEKHRMAQKEAEMEAVAAQKAEQAAARRAEREIATERKIQEARQQTIDKARLENRFSGAAGGWGGGGGGGGTINGVPVGSFAGGSGGAGGEAAAMAMNPALRSLVAPLAGAFGVNAMKNAIVEMEVLEARLHSVTGSAKNANEVFERLKILDRQLPHTISELSNAFALLIHYGFEPSEEALRSLSAIASASGQEIYDVAVTMQRATEGEFRNLKKYGISAQAEGDRIRFTFNGVSESVAKNSLAVEEYFVKLGKSGTFAEASANKMNTLAGSISNLESAWLSFMSTQSKGGIGDEMKVAVEWATKFVDAMDKTYRMTRAVIASQAELAAIQNAREEAAYELRQAKSGGNVDQVAFAQDRFNEAVQAEKKILDEFGKYGQISQGQVDRLFPDAETNLGKYLDPNVRASIERAAAAKKAQEELATANNVATMRANVAKRFNEHQFNEEKRKIDDENALRELDLQDKRRKDEISAFVAGMKGRDAQILDEYERSRDRINSFVELSGNERLELEKLSWQRSVEQLSEVADQRKQGFHNIYKDEIRQTKENFRQKKISHEQYLKELSDAEGRYRSNVGGIMVAGGTRFTPRIDPSEILGGSSESASDLRNQYVGGRASIEQEYKDKSARLWADPEQTDKMLEIQAAMDAEKNQRLLAQDDFEFKALESKYETQLRMLNESREAQKMTDETYTDESRRLWRQYTEDLAKISTTGASIVYMKNLEMSSTVLGMSANIAGQLDQLAQGQSDAAKATFMAVKSISIAQAIVNTELAATRAIAEGGFFAGVPMSAMIRGLGYASVAIMAATSVQEYAGKFADGGIVPGSSMSGDNLVARVNSGEMILNSGQQRNLFDMASGRMGGNSGITVNVYNEAGVEVETQTREDGKTIDLIIRRVKGEIASDLDTGKSQIGSVLEKRYAVRRRGA